MKGETFPKKHMRAKATFSRGVTLIELLVVVAILAVLAVVFFSGFTRQLSKGRDAQRKDHLEKLRVAFEDFYNDNECYPDLAVLENCGGTDLQPYLKEIPCDPQDELPYVVSSLGGNWCAGYRVLVQLENTTDPNIESMGCDATNGCYYDDETYNFGIAMGAPITDPDWVQEAGPTPVPTAIPTAIPTVAPTAVPTLPPGAWVIAPDGTCDYYVAEYLPSAGCPAEYLTYDQCFAVSGCTSSCTEDDVPLVLRCER